MAISRRKHVTAADMATSRVGTWHQHTGSAPEQFCSLSWYASDSPGEHAAATACGSRSSGAFDGAAATRHACQRTEVTCRQRWGGGQHAGARGARPSVRELATAGVVTIGSIRFGFEYAHTLVAARSSAAPVAAAQHATADG